MLTWEGRPHPRHTAVVTTVSQIAWDMVGRLLARAERSCSLDLSRACDATVLGSSTR